MRHAKERVVRRYSKWFLGLLFVVLIVEIMILAPGLINSSSPESVARDTSREDTSKSEAEQLMRGVHLVETSEGEKEWELWADEALAFKAEQKWTLENVKAIFFGKDGVFFTVTGDAGLVEPQSKNMQVRGNVVTRSSNGYVFKTNEVIYTSHTRSLLSPEHIDMLGPKDKNGNPLSLQGHGMNADLNESRIRIASQVRAEKIFSKGQKANITSNQAVFSGKNRKAMFHGNVVIDFDSMRMTGPDAEFDYDKDTGTVKTMFVKNGVRVSDAAKYATSDNVRVLFEEEKFVFRGAPKVVQNNDELRGEEIIFLNRGETVKVMKARARVEDPDKSSQGQGRQ
jgi:LPS export ABC transporter protein LptC